ncbi:hypothetical protein ACFCX0_29220 [Streptomyces sp. NPDC056352]|uniref:hypothetical protein n=1 Tax=Streptomyces sp. NPDC056352 TaxID=3345791 RepID=UPI0035D6671F
MDPGFFTDDPALFYGVLLARSPDSVRELAATWEQVRPRLGGLRGAFTEHAAAHGAWVGHFDAFTDLLEGWGRVLTEATRRGRGRRRTERVTRGPAPRACYSFWPV